LPPALLSMHVCAADSARAQAVVGYWRKHKDRLERKARGEEEPPAAKEEPADVKDGAAAPVAEGASAGGGSTAPASAGASGADTPAADTKKEQQRDDEEEEEEEEEEDEPSHAVRASVLAARALRCCSLQQNSVALRAAVPGCRGCACALAGMRGCTLLHV
jgi:hypothetical protein